MMAESSSTLESITTSDDFIINGIQHTIDSQVVLMPEGSHEFNLLNSLHQINDSNVEENQKLVQNDESDVTNFTNLSQIEVIDDGKPEQTGGFIGGLKKEKKPRKRGKGLKKQLNLTNDFERQSGCDCDKKGDKVRLKYFREEIEGLRFVGVEEQNKKWTEVYCGLGSAVAKEYDNLVGTKHDGEGNYVNFDPRPQFANKKGPATGNEADNKIGSEIQNGKQKDHVNGGDLELELEEDYYEDEEESDSEYVSIQRPAFVVTGEPDFDSGPPQDGLEYLSRVRWEAERIPKVKIAKVEKNVLNKEQTIYMPQIPDIAVCPEHLMPSKEWEDVFLVDFSNLRLALSQDENCASTFSDKIEFMDNVIQENLGLWQADDFTTTMIHENPNLTQTEDKTIVSDLPNLQTVVNMEPVARVTMLRKQITSLETKSCLSRSDCAWLFALCAAIDAPLNADTSALIRCLLRKCATLRAEKTSLDDEVIMLNILVSISGKYFGQLETK